MITVAFWAVQSAFLSFKALPLPAKGRKKPGLCLSGERMAANGPEGGIAPARETTCAHTPTCFRSARCAAVLG